MDGIRVSMTTLRQRLGDLVSRAAYGNERIILVSRGEPRAAIVGMADLKRLQELEIAAGSDASNQTLAAADEVRERIRVWQEAHGIKSGDVVADLNLLREVRDDQLSRMR